jgi:hypothetical protein
MAFTRTTKTKNTGMITNFDIESAKTINYKPGIDEATGEIVEADNKSKRLIIPIDSMPEAMQKLVHKHKNTVEIDKEDEEGNPTGEKYDAVVIKFSPSIYVAEPTEDGKENLYHDVWDNNKPNAELLNFEIGLTMPEVTIDKKGTKKTILRVKGLRFRDDSTFIEVKEEIFGMNTNQAIESGSVLAIEG